MKLITLTVQVAFLEDEAKSIGAVKNVLDRALVDGLGAEVLQFDNEQEWTDDRKDPDWDLDDSIEEWQEYAREELGKGAPDLRGIAPSKNS